MKFGRNLTFGFGFGFGGTSAGGSSVPINVALAANGATATATSTYDPASFSPEGAIDGQKHTNNGWNSPAAGTWVAQTCPETLTIDFGQTRTISQIDVYTLADAVNYNTNPTLADTFVSYGIVNFNIDYWNGSSWVAIPECTVTANNKVWRQFTFAPLAASKVRIVVTVSMDDTVRVVEFEVWGT